MKLTFLVLFLLISKTSVAMIADPDGVFYKNRLFCSHGNTVKAFETHDKKLNCNLIWNQKVPKVSWLTELPFKFVPDQFESGLEEDVQYCIVESLKVSRNRLLATSCEGKTYSLNPASGKVESVKTKRPLK